MKFLKLLLKRVAIAIIAFTLLIAFTLVLTVISIIHPLLLPVTILAVIIIAIAIITWNET